MFATWFTVPLCLNGWFLHTRLDRQALFRKSLSQSLPSPPSAKFIVVERSASRSACMHWLCIISLVVVMAGTAGVQYSLEITGLSPMVPLETSTLYQDPEKHSMTINPSLVCTHGFSQSVGLQNWVTGHCSRSFAYSPSRYTVKPRTAHIQPRCPSSTA